MKISVVLLGSIVFLSAASFLSAGEAVFYWGVQTPGKLTWSSATDALADSLEGQSGSTFGARFSKGRTIGFEQNISYSPRFGKPGVKAFQMDSNLLIQAPGKVSPYVTAGSGFIKTWGPDFPSDLDPATIAAAAFSFGTKFSINYGGGIKLRRILGPLGFGVDVRGYTLPSVHDGTLNTMQASIGAVFTW